MRTLMIGAMVIAFAALWMFDTDATSAQETAKKAAAPTLKVGDKAPAFTSIDDDGKVFKSSDVVGKLKVSAVLQAMPGIGKIRATQIMEKLKIADSRRLRGLGEQQRKALLGEFSANGK